MQRTLLPALLLLAVVAAASCGGAVSPGSGDPVTATAERDGVRVTLLLPARVFAPGSIIWADVRIENTTDRAVSWVGGGCNFPAHVSATIPPDDAGRTWSGGLGAWKLALLEGYAARAFFVPEVAWADYQRGGGGPICTADIRINQLAPKGSLSLRAAWDGNLPAEASRPRAPQGASEVSAVFPLGTLDGSSPIVARAKIELAGGPRIVAAALALDAALDDARFRGWLEARLAAETADSPVVGSFRLENEDWRLHVAQKLVTDTPSRPVAGYEADVVVDGKTGAVLSVDVAQRP